MKDPQIQIRFMVEGLRAVQTNDDELMRLRIQLTAAQRRITELELELSDKELELDCAYRKNPVNSMAEALMAEIRSLTL